MLVFLVGCGTLTGIPSHGGGKRFAIEQRLVSTTVRGAIKEIDLTALRGKTVFLQITSINDQGAGNMIGGRASALFSLQGITESSPVTSIKNTFKVFDLSSSGSTTNRQSSSGGTVSTTDAFSNTATSTSTQTSVDTTSAGTNISSTDTTGTTTDTSTTDGARNGTTQGTRTSTSNDTGTSSTTGTNQSTGTSTNNSDTTSSDTGTSTTNSTGTSTNTTNGSNTQDTTVNNTTTSNGTSNTTGTSSDNSSSTVNTTGTSNSTGQVNTTGTSSVTTQTGGTVTNQNGTSSGTTNSTNNGNTSSTATGTNTSTGSSTSDTTSSNTANTTGTSNTTGTNTSTSNGSTTDNSTTNSTNNGTRSTTQTGTNTNTGSSTSDTTSNNTRTTNGSDSVTLDETNTSATTGSGTNASTSNTSGSTGQAESSSTSTDTNTRQNTRSGSTTRTSNFGDSASSTQTQQTQQVLAPQPEETTSQVRGTGYRSTYGIEYRGQGNYQNFNVPVSDVGILQSIIRTYFYLNDVQITLDPNNPAIEAIVNINVDVFGSIRSRLDTVVYNKETVKVQTVLEVMAIDFRDHTLVMLPQTGSYEAIYDEKYAFWIGPLNRNSKRIRHHSMADPMLVTFDDVAQAKMERDRLAALNGSLLPQATPPTQARTSPFAAPQAQPPTQTTPNADERSLIEIQQTLSGWLKSWETANVADYLQYYSPAFVPGNGVSRERWQRERTHRLTAATGIKVNLKNPQIRLTPDQTGARVTFLQDYQSDGYTDSEVKTLELEKVGGQWKIVREQGASSP